MIEGHTVFEKSLRKECIDQVFATVSQVTAGADFHLNTVMATSGQISAHNAHPVHFSMQVIWAGV
jgi:hypothetical protein